MILTIKTAEILIAQPFFAGVKSGNKSASKRGMSRPKFLGGQGNKQLTLESLPDDSYNSTLHSKESVRRGSFNSLLGSTLSSSVAGSMEDLNNVTEADSMSQHARIGFCDTPEGTMERPPPRKLNTLIINLNTSNINFILYYYPLYESYQLI